MYNKAICLYCFPVCLKVMVGESQQISEVIRLSQKFTRCMSFPFILFSSIIVAIFITVITVTHFPFS